MKYDEENIILFFGKKHSEKSLSEMKKSKIGNNYGKNKRLDLDIYKIVQMKNDEISLSEIATFFKCSKRTIKRRLNEFFS